MVSVQTVLIIGVPTGESKFPDSVACWDTPKLIDVRLAAYGSRSSNRDEERCVYDVLPPEPYRLKTGTAQGEHIIATDAMPIPPRHACE